MLFFAAAQMGVIAADSLVRMRGWVARGSGVGGAAAVRLPARLQVGVCKEAEAPGWNEPRLLRLLTELPLSLDNGEGCGEASRRVVRRCLQ